ncbi:unnamed protein product, partial [Timema podura]|nr:unnamed protein product [Timema podura]
MAYAYRNPPQIIPACNEVSRAKSSDLSSTLHTVFLENPLSREAWCVDLPGLRVNISLTAATFFGVRTVDNNRTYHFQAEDDADQRAWMSVLVNCKESALMRAFDDNTKTGGSKLNQSHVELQQAIIRYVQKLPGNDRCCDCNSQNGSQARGIDILWAAAEFVIVKSCCVLRLFCGVAVKVMLIARWKYIAELRCYSMQVGNKGSPLSTLVTCANFVQVQAIKKTRQDATWLSTNFGIIVCIECSGIHRDLGVHISRIQSLTLDNVGTSQLLLVRHMTNVLFNEIMEATLQQSSKPTPSSTMEERCEFIRAKYVERKFTLQTCEDERDLLSDLEHAVNNKDLHQLLQVFAEGVDLASALPTSVSYIYKI